jgi:hypothetical protein
LGQFAGGIIYPPGRFSSEHIEIEGDIGDRESESTAQGHKIGWMMGKRYGLIVLRSLMATACVFPYLLHVQDAATQPTLNSILDSLERTGEQNPALSRHYDVTREYKAFRRNDPKPISDVTAQVSFTPPDTKTFRITDAQGSSTGERIVSAVLEHEIASAKEGHQHDTSRANYDFVFLREQNFGVVPEYVLHIIPKRNEMVLLLGDIWVDAETHRVRQIIGVPLKTPLWIKDLHITVQFAAVNGMWIPFSVDAIATVRFLGIYSLSAVDLAPPIAGSIPPNLDKQCLC